MPSAKPYAAHPALGASIGVVGGLFASLVMNWVQQLVSSSGGSDDDPATVKVAERGTRALTGQAIPEHAKPAVDTAVHYGLGAMLGLVYGLVAEYWPGVTTGAGTSFGTAVALVLDDAAVPALGAAEPPWQTNASTHAYAIASHLVFGLSLEAMRRTLRIIASGDR